MTDELDLVRSLGESIEPDQDVRDRVYAAAQARLTASPRRPRLLWSLGAAAALILVAAVVLLVRSPAHVTPRPEAVPNFPRGWSLKPSAGFMGIGTPWPFYGARDMSLAQAEQFLMTIRPVVQIPRPDDPLANDDQIQDVWVGQSPVDGGGIETQIRIVYSTGVYIELGPAIPSDVGDPAAQLKRFKEIAAEDSAQTGGRARVTSVAGNPAYFLPRGAAMSANGESQGNGGDVTFYLGAEVVDVVGLPSVSDTDLLRIASSVASRPA